MANKKKTLFYHLIAPFRSVYLAIFQYLKNSKLAKILIIIVIIKMLIFHGLFQGFLFPKYFKPKWDSEKHQIEDVVKHIVPEQKNK